MRAEERRAGDRELPSLECRRVGLSSRVRNEHLIGVEKAAVGVGRTGPDELGVDGLAVLVAQLDRPRQARPRRQPDLPPPLRPSDIHRASRARCRS